MRIACTMPGDFCILCGNSRLKKGDSSRLSYHRFPKNLEKRTQWLRAFHLSADVIKDHSRVCSRHFYGGDPKNGPDPNVGRKFASPIKKHTSRSKRAKRRQEERDYHKACSSKSSTPMAPSPPDSPGSDAPVTLHL